MRLTLDATSLLLPSAGVKTHLYYWISSLLESAPANIEISLYPPPFPGRLALDHLKSTGGSLRTALGLGLVRFANIRGNPATGFLLSGADLFHCSQHTANRPRRPKVTATVFDLSCWTTPQFHTPANIAATRRYGEKILKTCDGLIANSGHVRTDAVEILGIPPERVRVIYPGVSENWFSVTPEAAASASAHYGLDAPYILFIGCIEPRKNVSGLLRAYRTLPESLRANLELVVAGPFGWASEEIRADLDRTAGVRYLGYVPEADLPGLCVGARALMYPSFYEGFGLPLAQAMAAGTPVIAAARSCLPEVAGGAALLVDPDSSEEMASAIERVVTSTEAAERMAELGKVRAERFHWADSARQSIDFFREIAGN